MPAEASPTAAQPGDLIGAKYRIEHVLGSGAMGVLVAARHTQLGEKVALKFLRPELIGKPQLVARFLREARAAARFKSEHIARIVDLGTLEDGAPFIAMEFLEGCDLQEYLSKRGPLAVPEAVDFVVQACVAVAEAHAAGVVHRDLKPSNLFLTRRADGSSLVKVLDFGISKVVAGAEGRTDLTCSNAILGSPVYMSPEQAKNARSVDARADVWSLGVILHQLIAGKPPFWGESITEILSAVLTEAPVRLTQARPDAPPQLEAVILRCLERDIVRRMPDVAQLAAALEPWGGPGTRVLISRVAGTLHGAAPEGPIRATPRPPSDAPVPTMHGWSRGLHAPAGARVIVVAGIVLAILAIFVALRRPWNARDSAIARQAPSASATSPPTPNAAALPSTPSDVASSTPLAETRAPGSTLPSGVEPPFAHSPPIASSRPRRSPNGAHAALSAAGQELPTPKVSASAATATNSSSSFRDLFNDRR